MEALNLDDINRVAHSKDLGLLENEKKESDDLQTVLNNFVAGSHGTLSGEVWNKVQTKLNQFSSALSKRAELAARLSRAVHEALKILTDYMGDEYTYLDYSELDSLRAKVSDCKLRIQNIIVLLNKTERLERVDENGEKKIQIVYVVNGGERAAYNAEIDKLNADIVELEKRIKKLEGLPAVYKQAESILREAFSELSGFSEEVSSIVPSDKIVYMKE